MSRYMLLAVNSFLGIEEGVISLFLLIDAKIYSLIAYFYGLYNDYYQIFYPCEDRFTYADLSGSFV